MNNFQIETAQNISISQNVAGLGDRILAFLIDSLIIGFYLMIALIAMGGLNIGFRDQWVLYIILGLPVFLYYLLWHIFNNGQTPGKKGMSIRVVGLDGSRPKFSQHIIRWLLRIIDISLASGSIAVVSILISGKGQRLGDIAAKTTVISEKTRFTVEDTLQVDIPENYIPTYPQVTVLKDKDIQEIKRVYKSSLYHSQHQVIIYLSEKISKLLDIIPQQKPQDFIRTIIQDYNYYTQL